MTTPDVLRDADLVANVSNIPYEVEGHDHEVPTDSAELSRRHRKAVYNRARSLMLGHLLADLDVMVFCELSALYYMDCSIIHFGIRAIIQFLFFTPKSNPLAETTPNQPVVGAILSSNFLCILMHCLSSNPTAGESSRGYLQGGLFIDFVGQKGPISKFTLFLFDLSILVLQSMMMCALSEQEKLVSDATNTSGNNISHQNLDDEERGIRHSENAINNTIEMQDLNGSYLNSNALHEQMNREDELYGRKNRHPRDSITSAEASIVDMNIFNTMMDKWHSSSSSLSPTSVPVDNTASILARRLTVHINRTT